MMNKDSTMPFRALKAYRFWLQWLICSRWGLMIVVLAAIGSLWFLPQQFELWSYQRYPLVVEQKLLGLYNTVKEDPGRLQFVRYCWLGYFLLTAALVIAVLVSSYFKARRIALEKASQLIVQSTQLSAVNPSLSNRLVEKAMTYTISPAMASQVLQSTVVFGETKNQLDIEETVVLRDGKAESVQADMQIVGKQASSSSDVGLVGERRYRRIQELGRGAMGIVYLAHDTLLQRNVALKTIATSLTEAYDIEQRFFKEARMVARLNHPSIVQIYDFYESEGRGYIAMEYVMGRSLDTHIAKNSLSHSEKIKIAIAIASAMEYAHQMEVIHRDLKPGNILVTENLDVKLTDFGLAKVSGTQETQIGTVLGSPLYMSPEQAEGLPADHRSDIYAFGVLFYELLTGKHLFQGETATQVIAQHLTRVPDFSDDLVDRSLSEPEQKMLVVMLAKRPSERFQSFSEVLNNLLDLSIAL